MRLDKERKEKREQTVQSMFNQAAVEEGDSDELRDNPPGPVEAVFIRPIKTLISSQPLAPIEEDDELIISSIDVSKVEEPKQVHL